MNTPSLPTPSLQWQDEKRLSSGDLLWFLTDVQSEWRQFYTNSTPQQWFRVGALDLKTLKLGFVRFSIDDARSIIRAALPPPPWGAPLPYGIEVKRFAHIGGEEKGRFKEEMTLIDIPQDIAWMGPVGREAFRRAGHSPNAVWGMWKKLVVRWDQAKAIEVAALGMEGRFSAGDVKDVVGKDVNVTPVLTRLVDEKRLLPFGQGRGRTYEVAPASLPERVDWVG